jgi:hypothetical protein
MEIFSGLLIAQYFLLPKFVETMTENWKVVSLIACAIGAGILCACIISAVGMLICSACGLVYQTPWLWKRRMIHVPTERTSD